MASSMVTFHVAGWAQCGFYRKAATVLSSLSVMFPTKIKVVEHEYTSRDEYRSWLLGQPSPGFRETGLKGYTSYEKALTHTSSPFAWMEAGEDKSFIGGCDDTLAWCRSFAGVAGGGGGGTTTPVTTSSSSPKMVEDGFKNGHAYDYDVVVIGGGSGGLATSKEIAAQGGKVAVLDFVKPSTQGSTWGLGGTCVNVGCIPKKLMHQAAGVGTVINSDAPVFGYAGAKEEPHNWETMRENVQNHIRGLNFNYRVTLREKNVTYLNKLGSFIDKNTLQLTDKKGKISQVTAARFIVAVGGRPTGLDMGGDCEGHELAISSDDIFSLEKSPGKTLCVGASYISLECAGFLAGIGEDVTVAVRSILLRGFDREIADKIGASMEEHNVKFRREVTPKKLVKTADGRIEVTFSDGTSDVYDTVLAAVGRYADTSKMNLKAVGIEVNPKSGKIPCKFEQTSCPNIYAIGDVMEGCPELTPVAIQAGTLLARRLFGVTDLDKSNMMDYKNICTTVFTPIEYGVCGYSEDDAIKEYGADNIDVYHSSFTPLEWSLNEHRSKTPGFVKVITLKTNPGGPADKDEKVIGLHFFGPNAGEVLQGFGVAMKKGITFRDLAETVGIHPTSAEEFTTVSVTKRSGEDAAGKGC